MYVRPLSVSLTVQFRMSFLAICWERAVPLSFHLCYFYFSAVLIVGVPFPFGVEGRMRNSIASVPDHCFFIYIRMVKSIQTLANFS